MRSHQTQRRRRRRISTRLYSKIALRENGGNGHGVYEEEEEGGGGGEALFAIEKEEARVITGSIKRTYNHQRS